MKSVQENEDSVREMGQRLSLQGESVLEDHQGFGMQEIYEVTLREGADLEKVGMWGVTDQTNTETVHVTLK